MSWRAEPGWASRGRQAVGEAARRGSGSERFSGICWVGAVGPARPLCRQSPEGLGERTGLTDCPCPSVQGSVGMASMPPSAQMCSPCSRGRHTTSCKCCTRASRARSGQEDPTLMSGTGRACCSS